MYNFYIAVVAYLFIPVALLNHAYLKTFIVFVFYTSITMLIILEYLLTFALKHYFMIINLQFFSYSFLFIFNFLIGLTLIYLIDIIFNANLALIIISYLQFI